MILYPPERFDVNEWFVLSAVALVFIVSFLLPKRLSAIEITVIAVFSLYLSQTVDSLIAVTPFDFYDVSDSAKYEIMDIVIYYLLYPPVAYIFLHFYDRLQLNTIRLILYVIGWSLLTAFLEWLSVLCHVFTYKGWHIVYSPFVYIGVYTLNILVLRITRHWERGGGEWKQARKVPR
ncbi:hypothetical protein ACFQI7_02465 [Paenibacillus allorhizosphaerae]|uniref:Uncharacterized protein n=1 Tax=Paenibacillus allorhizosphaerae TaxID=2849866 RepID=A0ABM8VAY1_9BACL|nr:hypothetical protein [Paenibacillus allorhizosphaerae]CAG7617817.1 hypothetical protein PAECIP111802_00454 [Paenibacillus allorhizosphaerae]